MPSRAVRAGVSTEKNEQPPIGTRPSIRSMTKLDFEGSFSIMSMNAW